MKRCFRHAVCALSLLVTVFVATSRAGEYRLIGWNDLGMHCMDGLDFSVFSVLPPYNTFHAQLIRSGKLVTNAAGYSLTYEAVRDPGGSINTTSRGKGNFWDYAEIIYGAALAPDVGLAGFSMPGASNAPQAMSFSSAFNWFSGEGVPITPFDDAGFRNAYPMMRLVARDSTGLAVASTDIVLPVSDEMDCRLCHASGTAAEAHPAAGWVGHADVQRDVKLNTLLLHDERQAGNPVYSNALAAAGFHPEGLYATVIANKRPMLCARCHASNALPGTGIPGISPLTTAMHARHANVFDPVLHVPLNNSANRAACYRCHPGSQTRCLRGAMGAAVASDGSMEMQCQSCHGSMSEVGASGRIGWLQQPNCQACHTGSANNNSGQIRYTTVFDAPGRIRTPASALFATTPDTPIAGVSLYRFSRGHGGLQCEACHGSTHGEYPSSHLNDNLQSTNAQGHVGMLIECGACHTTVPLTAAGGPHGMHTVGQTWVSQHGDFAEGSLTPCAACHGTDFRGTILSRAQANRTFSSDYGTKTFARGSQIGCYACHNGPGSTVASLNRKPTVAPATMTTAADMPVTRSLSGSDADGDTLTWRIVSQPQNGTVALSGSNATYYPSGGFMGADSFTYCVWDGSVDSAPAQVSVTVLQGACELVVSKVVPAGARQNLAVPFRATAALQHCVAEPRFEWTFGDGSPVSTNGITAHVYTNVGFYSWQLSVSANSVTEIVNGAIWVERFPVIQCGSDPVAGPQTILMSWSDHADSFVLESRRSLDSSDAWAVATNKLEFKNNQFLLRIDSPQKNQFYRLRCSTP